MLDKLFFLFQMRQQLNVGATMSRQADSNAKSRTKEQRPASARSRASKQQLWQVWALPR